MECHRVRVWLLENLKQFEALLIGVIYIGYLGGRRRRHDKEVSLFGRSNKNINKLRREKTERFVIFKPVNFGTWFFFFTLICTHMYRQKTLIEQSKQFKWIICWTAFHESRSKGKTQSRSQRNRGVHKKYYKKGWVLIILTKYRIYV